MYITSSSVFQKTFEKNKEGVPMNVLPQVNGEKRRNRILLVAEPQGGASATIAVRWCLCPTLLDKLKERIDFTPYLLLIVSRDGDETDRRLVPLEQALEYVSFDQPGTYKIQATILRGENMDSFKRRLFKKAHSYHYPLLDVRGRIIKRDALAKIHDGVCSKIGYGETQPIAVAAEFFAKKPADWKWDWINAFYETLPRDQCQFRRRALFAFSIQPLIVLLLAVVRLVIAITLRFGCGARGIDFAPVLYPINYGTDDVWRDFKHSDSKFFFLTNKTGGKRPLGFWIFTPLISLALFFTGIVIFREWTSGIGGAGLAGLAYVIGSYVFMILISWLVDFGSWTILALFPSVNLKAWRKNRQALKVQRREAALKAEYHELYEPLVCQGTQMRASFKDLPKARRTLYLRFMDIKAKICKPFAK